MAKAIYLGGPNNNNNNPLSKTAKIVIAVLVPVAFIAVTMGVVLWARRVRARRRIAQRAAQEKRAADLAAQRTGGYDQTGL